MQCLHNKDNEALVKKDLSPPLKYQQIQPEDIIPTGLHSTKNKAGAMALEEAATILERSERTKKNKK